MKNLFKRSYARIMTYFLLLTGVIIPLNGWSDHTKLQEQHSDILIAAKAFNKDDCQKYLDRDLLAKGYQPIQVIVKNHSDKVVVFSPDNVNLPCVSVDEVIASACISTAGRSAGYGVGAIFFFPLIVPAIADGTKSAKANRVLEADYHYKAAKKQTLPPNSTLNKLLFISANNCPEQFKVILTEEGSNRTYEHVVVISKFA